MLTTHSDFGETPPLRRVPSAGTAGPLELLSEEPTHSITIATRSDGGVAVQALAKLEPQSRT